MLCFRTTVFFLMMATVAVADPIQWPESEGGNGNYYDLVTFSDDFLSWTDSRNAAASQMWDGAAGHLATLTSEAENNWVFANLGSPYAYYLGAFQPAGSGEPGGGWQWVTQEDWSYTNWWSGEPNNAGSGPSGEEDCLQFSGFAATPGTWNDADFLNVPVGGAPGYVVEYQVTPVQSEGVTWSTIRALFR